MEIAAPLRENYGLPRHPGTEVKQRRVRDALQRSVAELAHDAVLVHLPPCRNAAVARANDPKPASLMDDVGRACLGVALAHPPRERQLGLPPREQASTLLLPRRPPCDARQRESGDENIWRVLVPRHRFRHAPCFQHLRQLEQATARAFVHGQVVQLLVDLGDKHIPVVISRPMDPHVGVKVARRAVHLSSAPRPQERAAATAAPPRALVEASTPGCRTEVLLRRRVPVHGARLAKSRQGARTGLRRPAA
mmetsp:Transcript_58933/g.179764  ORF Transcript_58933/g.179764 Transcript_58933/m.179764 type:complete len:250 (-) Transcript_58933:13-762(-)